MNITSQPELIPGKTTFDWKGHHYRLTGFYYAYFSKEGWMMQAIRCSRDQANAVSGYGVSGCIVPIDSIAILDRVIPHDHFIESESKTTNLGWTVEETIEAIDRLKAKKPNMSKRGWAISEGMAFKKAIDRFVDEMTDSAI